MSIKICKECHTAYESEHDDTMCSKCIPAQPKQSKETIIWHPSPSLPKKEGWYLVTRITRTVFTEYFMTASPNIQAHWEGHYTIIAWAEMPKGWVAG